MKKLTYDFERKNTYFAQWQYYIEQELQKLRYEEE